MSRPLGVLAILSTAMLVAVGSCVGPEQAERQRRKELERTLPTEPAARLVALESLGPNPEQFGRELQDLLSSPDLVLRASAAQLLAAWAADSDPDLVLPAIHHADPLVRALAQASYMEHSAGGLAPLDVQGTVLEVPPAVLQALGRMGDPQGLADLEPLIVAERDSLRLRLDASPHEAVLAADLLARTGDIAARRKLIRLSETADGAVLAKTARAAVRPRMGLGTTVLADIFSASGETPRGARGDVVARRGVMRALVVCPEPRLTDLVVQGLDDEDVAVRRNAIRAMGNLGGSAPLQDLMVILSAKAPAETGDLGEKYDVLRALGAIGGERAAGILRRYILGGPETRDLEIQALFAIAPHATRGDVAWASHYLQSESPFLRAAGATVLGQIGHPSAQAALMNAVADNVPLVRTAVVKALGQIGTEYAAKHLATMLDDPDPTVRATVIWGLGATKHAEATPDLVKMVRAAVHVDPPPRVSDFYATPELAAVLALGRIGSPEAIAALSETLESPSWILRATAAQALAVAQPLADDVKDALRRRLKDPVNLARAEALLGLEAAGETFPPGYFQTH